MKKTLLMAMMMLVGIISAFAEETTFSPVLDVNFRTAAGNTSWQAVKNAADDGNNDFELTYASGFFSLQKFTVPNLSLATKLVLTLTVGSKSGVDAVEVWPFANNSWTAESGVDDLISLVTTSVGIAPRATEGSANTPLAKGSKVADSSPAKATFTISGDALATLKANASSDGTFTLLLTNNKYTDANSKRSYLSVNSANDEANRPTLVATLDAPTAKIVGGESYKTLADAWAAAVTADADATIEVSGDQKLTARLTWNKAHTLNIVPTADITIKGPKNAMWFLVNTNNATLNIGASDHKITFDGISDDRSSYSNVDVIRRENTTQLSVTNVEFKDFVCGANHLVSCKNNGGAITLQSITFTNSSSTHALIDNQRVANDALVLKGYLNVADDCSGLVINNVANLKSDGTTEGRVKVDDSNFTASKAVTISWVSSDVAKDVFVAGSSVVVGVTSNDIATCFTLSGAPEGWTMARVNNDLKLQAPVTPTAKIGETGYADLAAALAAVQDGDVIMLLDDQEISSRVNIKNISFSIMGDGEAKTIKRATGYKNGLLFLTQTPDEGMPSSLSLANVILDDQNVETSAAMIEAANGGEVTLRRVTVKNVNTTANAAIVNKSGGSLTLREVTFTGCTAAKGDVFVGTNNVRLSGNLTIGSIYVEKNLYLSADDDVTAATPIALITDATRSYTLLVEGGVASQFTNTSFRLSQQQDGVYAMPLPVAFEYAHPALLHNSADIEAVKSRLLTNDAVINAAYSQLETSSAASPAGAVEYLKRMDQKNWESVYPDFNNFNAAATDAKLAYQLALRYQLKGSEAAATAAVNILNNWASVNKGFLRLTGYNNNIPDPNEYLMCIQAYQFANAAELLRGYTGWQAADFTKFQNWIRQTFADVAILFLENHHQNANPKHYWLNWDLAALNAMLSVGILCNDQALVDYALAYPANGQGTGNYENAVVATYTDTPTGETLAQCQESGRDQGHATLDITLLGVLCQTAQHIGTDLFTPYKALEMAEYVGKYNLKDAAENFVYTDNDLSFTAYSNGDEGVNHTVISADARGTERPCWELFLAYAKQNEKNATYTTEWVKYLRNKYAWGEGAPETTDELGFGTLMFSTANDIPTGIQMLQTSDVEVSDCYNLAGQRVEKMGRGIYIVNGKKMLVK